MRKKSPELVKIAELKFRPLKKNLSKTFKEIRLAVESGSLPDRSQLEQFVAEAKLMTAYPGFGDENYEAFLTACNELTPIYNSKNLLKFKEQLATIRRLKKQCHHQFK